MGMRRPIRGGAAVMVLSLFLAAGSCLESPSAMMVGVAEGQAGRGEYDEAIKSFDRALEMSPDSSYVYEHRGEFYFKMERYEEAASDLGMAMDLYPKNKRIYRIRTMRGDCYRNLGRYKEAVVEYETALSARPNYAPALFGRGLCRAAAGADTEALADLGRACGLKYAPACDAYEDISSRHIGRDAP